MAGKLGAYHIDINDKIVPCPAKVKCRRGGPHFSSMSEGLAYNHALEDSELKTIPDPARRQEISERITTTRGQRTVVRDAFAKLDSGLLFEEKTKDGEVVEMRSVGPSTGVIYLLRPMKGGKVISAYVKDGQVVRRGTIHETLEEAEKFAQGMESAGPEGFEAYEG